MPSVCRENLVRLDCSTVLQGSAGSALLPKTQHPAPASRFLEVLSGEDSVVLRVKCKKVGTLSLPAITGKGKGKMGPERWLCG